MKHVKFIHMLFAGLAIMIMSIVAVFFEHTTIAGAAQDVITVLGILALTVVIASVKWKKS